MFDNHGYFPLLAPLPPRKPATVARLRAMARQVAGSSGLTDWTEYGGERPLKPLLMALARRSLPMADREILLSMTDKEPKETR